jgi:hypothetical protein
MIHRTFLLLAAAGTIAAAGAAQTKSAAKPTADETGDDLNLLNLEVEALQALHELELNPAQLRQLLPLAQACAEKARRREPVKASPALRQALQDLREALVGGDDDRISEQEERFDGLVEKEGSDFDDEVEITEVARKRAPEAVRLLGLKQLVAFVSAHGDDLADPRTAIEEALTEGKEFKDEEWAEHRDASAEEVAEVLAGLDAGKAAQAKKRVADLLDRWHGKAVRPEALEEDVRRLVGNLSAAAMLHNAWEVHVARMLSNPQMPAALRARLQPRMK